MVIEQQVDGEIDAQVGRGVWQGGAGVLWSVGGGVCYWGGDSLHLEQQVDGKKHK